MISEEFWRGKRVFLTGHTGFKGSWLALWLQRLGADVTGYALEPPTVPSLFSLANVSSGMRDVRGDVRDLKTLQNAISMAKPDIVIHMAAQSLVLRSYQEPVESYATNVMGTAHVLEAVRQAGSVRAALIITSDKCYENREWLWGYRENEPMGGFDPYSSSKGCAELVTSAYRNSYFGTTETAVGSARAGNVIGGGDWATDRLLPDMMRSALEGRKTYLRNPGAIRPWQHVLEPLYGYLILAERLCLQGQEFAEGWNFGPSDADAKPVDWVTSEVSSLWEDVQWETDGTDHPHEAHHLKLDCSKAHKRLGWTPLLSIGQALSWTVDWYKTYARGLDVRQFTAAQIEDYCKLRKAHT